MKYILSVLVLTLSIVTSAEACMGLMLEVQTFLPRLPKDISQVDYVAQVEVVDKGEVHSGFAEVRELEVYKGEAPKKEFTVMYSTHSCANADYNIQVPQKYYVAGHFDSNGTFTGEWRRMHPMLGETEEFLGTKH